jgi:opacity protein-like surface antigen
MRIFIDKNELVRLEANQYWFGDIGNKRSYRLRARNIWAGTRNRTIDFQNDDMAFVLADASIMTLRLNQVSATSFIAQLEKSKMPTEDIKLRLASQLEIEAQREAERAALLVQRREERRAGRENSFGAHVDVGQDSYWALGVNWLYNRNGPFRLEIPVSYSLPKDHGHGIKSSSLGVQTLGHYLLLNNERINLYPLAGLGLGFGITNSSNDAVKSSTDTNFLIPFGAGVDFKVVPNFALNISVKFGVTFANSETNVGFSVVTIGFRL